MKQKELICLLIFLLSMLAFFWYQNNQLTSPDKSTNCNTDDNQQETSTQHNREKNSIYDDNISRDFRRYPCKEMKRIGGHSAALQYNEGRDKLWRIEGAWFLCVDAAFAPKSNACTVFSFGVNDDPSFDNLMTTEYGCQVESFDPFIEADKFKSLRIGDQTNATSLKVTPKWRFHRIGISNQNQQDKENQIGWLTTFSHILDYTGLRNKHIDVIKMDTEGAEWQFFQGLDMDYMCKYVRQFVFETHPTHLSWSEHAKILRKLEKCFRLFHRDTRFYVENGFLKTEFQEPIEYSVPLKNYKSENNLMDYMVSIGELYFVNINFL